MLNGSMIPRSVRRMFDERAEPRTEAGCESAMLELRGRRYQVSVVNVSASGAMVIFGPLPHIGEEVVLHLGDRDPASGQVCWVRDGRIGVNFAASVG